MQLRPFHPGTNPCNDACSLEWAVDAFGVEQLLLVAPTAITLPAETILSGMSYAKRNEPYYSAQGYYTIEPLTARGYHLHGSTWFVQIDACNNWTIATIVETFDGRALSVHDEHRPEIFSTAAPNQQSWSHPWVASSCFDCGSNSIVVIHDDFDRHVDGTIPPIPLPPTVTLLIGALLCLFLSRLRLVTRRTEASPKQHAACTKKA
jgi:hypothetical protein